MFQTYNTDRQVADSAGSGNALFTGVKTKYEVIGVDDSIEFAKCASATTAAVDSILVSAEEVGMYSKWVCTQNRSNCSYQNYKFKA